VVRTETDTLSYLEELRSLLYAAEMFFLVKSDFVTNFLSSHNILPVQGNHDVLLTASREKQLLSL
jgi:hypothetical protein